jgi:hypothetical protein
VTDHRETPTFIVKLRPLRNVRDPIINLRQALKVLLRRFHLKCVAAQEEKCLSVEESPANTGGPS